MNEIPRKRRRSRGRGLLPRHVQPPEVPRAHTDPTFADWQINPAVEVRREEDGSFFVMGVLRSGGSWKHYLTARCDYCHKVLSITATGSPSPMPVFARDEARRLAILEHLRTDHRVKPKSQT